MLMDLLSKAATVAMLSFVVYADPRTMPSIAVFPSIFRDLYVGDSA